MTNVRPIAAASATAASKDILMLLKPPRSFSSVRYFVAFPSESPWYIGPRYAASL